MNSQVVVVTDEELTQPTATEEAGFGCLHSERGPFPLQELHVHARVDGLLAQVEVRQTFVNVIGEPLEATYIFPLSDQAAVTSFTMEVNGRQIEAVLEERAKAREQYETAVREGYRAAISEEERPDVFSLRVGNLLAGEKATVVFRMVQPLSCSDGEATFRFPLVVAPRYVPGVPLPDDNVGLGTVPDTDAVPDASRITPPVLLPGFLNPVRLTLTVDIDPAGLPLSDFKTSLHGVRVERTERGGFRVELYPGERLNRDFILRFRIGDEAIRTSLMLQPDGPKANQGTFTLILVPSTASPDQHKPRDVVFLLDRSGSMDGWKIVAARRALMAMIETLAPRDRFTVLAFDNIVEIPPGFPNNGVVPVDQRHRQKCCAWLRHIDSRGGTELYEPLDRAVEILSRCPAERERVLVLLTDGQVGNESQLLAMLKTRLQGLRVYTVGIDQAVNAGFLRRLARLGGGTCELVESEERLVEVMSRIHRHLCTPVLTDLRLESSDLTLDGASITPFRLPDLFVGTPLVVMGRYQGQSSGSITVHARGADGRPWQTSVQGCLTNNPAHTGLWARSRLRDLEDQYDAGHADHTTLEQQIIQTSLQFGVLCRFTAFVAVDRSEQVNAGGKVQRFVQPVDLPAGWQTAPVVYSPPSSPMPADGTVLGLMITKPILSVLKSFKRSRSRDDILTLRFLTASEAEPPRISADNGQGDMADSHRWVAELLQLLQDGKDQPLSERKDILRSLLKKLQQMLSDLQRSRLAQELYQPLQQLELKLSIFVTESAGEALDEQLWQQYWEETENTLRRFQAELAKESSSRRRSFWK